MRIVVILLLLPLIVYAESKVEADLRARLAASEAAHAAALKDKTAISAALEKLTAQATARAASAAKVEALGRKQAASLTASSAQKMTDTIVGSAQVSASNAQVTAEINAGIAQQAAAVAATVALQASATAAEAKARTDVLVIGQYVTVALALLSLVGTGLKFWYDIYNKNLDHKWSDEKEARAESRKKEVLTAVQVGAADSTRAIDRSNHLTQKIVDLREDLVTAVQQTQPGQQNRIETTGIDTNQRVQKVEAKIATKEDKA